MLDPFSLLPILTQDVYSLLSSYFSHLKVESLLSMSLQCHAQAGLGRGLCPLLLPCTEPQPSYITSNRICRHIRGSDRQHECITIINTTTSILAKHPLLKTWMYQLFANRSSKHQVKNVQGNNNNDRSRDKSILVESNNARLL